MELYVRDTELTIPIRGRGCSYCPKTKWKPRVSDGKKHPVVVIKPKEK